MDSLTPAPAVVDGDFNVSEEDQQKINRFARLNARLEEVKDELSLKSNEIKNYEDALNELELGLFDDDDEDANLHIQVGDLLVKLPPKKTETWLEEKKTKEKQLFEELETKKSVITTEMAALKTELYARFGSNIHLESS